MIKKALVDAGFPQVPVISVAFEDLGNYQPGFSIPVRKILPMFFYGIMYGDVLAKFYYPAAVREREPGQAKALRDKYLQLGVEAALRKDRKALLRLLGEAAAEFNAICIEKETRKVGVVGEIFLKPRMLRGENLFDLVDQRDRIRRDIAHRQFSAGLGIQIQGDISVKRVCPSGKCPPKTSET